MNAIEKNIVDFLHDFNIENSQNTYLVAFSGGYDSMCLLNCLKNVCSNRIVAIHLNHNWRGEESNKEEQNCADFCSKIGIEFYSEGVNVAPNETDSRKIRYDFFQKCSKKFHSNIIFTAHNKNDNAETLIFRICHGTGIRGLQGILPKRDIYYRPLLNIERKDIEAYCRENNLTPNHDSSNDDNIHKRNLIRNEILPQMYKINQSVIDNINSLSVIAQEETDIIKEYIKNILSNISQNEKISTKKFLELSEPVKNRILYELITPLLSGDYDKQRLLILKEFINDNKLSKSGKTISITTDKWLFVSDKFIEIISKNEKNNLYVHITKEGEYEFDGIYINITKCDTKPDKLPASDSRFIYADLSRGGLNVLNLFLRHRTDGDIIQPIGLKGTQKLKKLLNSHKIPNHEKDKLIILSNDKEVLWCAGVCISDKIKIKNKPTHKIEIVTK